MEGALCPLAYGRHLQLKSFDSHLFLNFLFLSAPYRKHIAILLLRYPVSRDTFSVGLALPQEGTVPPPWYCHLHRHMCDSPFCNILRGTYAKVAKEKKKHKRASLLASRDIKSIVVGALGAV